MDIAANSCGCFCWVRLLNSLHIQMKVLLYHQSKALTERGIGNLCRWRNAQLCRSICRCQVLGKFSDFYDGKPSPICLHRSCHTAPMSGICILWLRDRIEYRTAIRMQVYVWARRNPYTTLSFLGMFTFTAPYLPWVLLGVSILLRSSPVVDLLGIASGK